MTFGSCPEWVAVDGDLGTLACWLDAGHDGPHYDEADDVTWQKGKPDGV